MCGFDIYPPRCKLSGFGLLLAILLLTACSSQAAEPFQGTELTAKNPATPFELQDQFGKNISLSDFDEDVVLLTFLYTNCPDVCPITTSQLRDAHEMLGEDADEVSFVAISVDPERDSIESTRNYSEKWKMTDKWSFLVGAEEELRPIWKAYYIDPAINEQSREAVQVQNPPANALPERSGGVSALRQDILERYLIIHSAPVYLIDRNRAMRVVFTLPFDTKALVHDIRLLLNNS